MKKLITASLPALVVLLVGLVAAPALAQYPPAPDTTDATVSDTTVAAGGTITITGTGWQPASTVQFTLDQAEVLGSTTVAADTTFQSQVTIPSDVAAGAHTIVVAGTGEDGQPRTDTIPLTITGAAAGAPATGGAGGGGLAATGLSTVLLVGLAGGALLFGGLAVRRSRAGSRG